MKTGAELVKEYLNRLKDTYDYARELEKEIESISPITSTQTDSVRSGRKYTESGLAPADKRLAIMEACEEAKCKYFTLKNDLLMQLEKLPNAQYADLLYYRYVHFMPFDKVAKAIHREYNYTCSMHGEALISFGCINGIIKSELPQISEGH